MRYDRQKAFPYPVLRPQSDDYVDSEFQTTADFTINNGCDEIKVEISFALSCAEIVSAIKGGLAEYAAVISCRDTFFRYIINTEEAKNIAKISTGLLRGEVRVESYVVVKKDIASYESPDINSEFGGGTFTFSPGDILAQDEPQVFYIDRDLFKPVTSVFDLVKKDALSGAEWRLGYELDHIQIEVSPAMKEKIDNARNDPKNRVILLNSIYFAAVMQAVQKLKESLSSGEYEACSWAQVIQKQAHNKGVDITIHDAYLIAERLMQYPLALLETQVFKGGEQ